MKKEEEKRNPKLISTADAKNPVSGNSYTIKLTIKPENNRTEKHALFDERESTKPQYFAHV